VIEYPIGSVVKLGDIEGVVVRNPLLACEECSLQGTGPTCIGFPCTSSLRSDKEYVQVFSILEYTTRRLKGTLPS